GKCASTRQGRVGALRDHLPRLAQTVRIPRAEHAQLGMPALELGAHVPADVDLVDGQRTEQAGDLNVVDPGVADLDVLHDHAVQAAAAEVDTQKVRVLQVVVAVFDHRAI